MDSIVVTNLSYRYKSNNYWSIDNLNFQIKAKQCTGIIGPNGAGKSTLISALCGLLPDFKGEIVYPLSSHKTLIDAVKAQVALVPQEYAFYPQLSVLQNLEYFSSLCGKQNQTEIITKIVNQCQLNGVINQTVKKLSGGFKRRLNIAIALVKMPDVLFLDEPTVGIDPESRDVIIALLNELKQQGKTLIFTSHMLDEVEKLCDEVLVLKDGKLMAQNNDNAVVEIRFSSPFVGHVPSFLQANDKPLTYRAKPSEEINIATILDFAAKHSANIDRVYYNAKSIDHLYRQSLKE